MKPNTRVLFLGNGLNNLGTNNQSSWLTLLTENLDATLKKICLEKNKDGLEVVKPYIQYPFLSDVSDKVHSWSFFNTHSKEAQLRTLNNQLKNSNTTEEIRLLRDACLHNYDAVITTNFTTELEYEGIWKQNSVKNEIRYNLFRKYSNDTNSIWYIHGRYGAKNSIIIGQNQYVEQSGLVASYLNGKYRLPDIGRINPMKNRVTKGSLSRAKILSWIDYFFLPDCQIDIVGFTLSFSELDVWYLLKERSKLFKDLKNNTVTFHSKKSNEYEKCRDAILAANDVEVLDYSKKSYSKMYKEILMK